MPASPTPKKPVSGRRRPRQARSKETVASILEAAARVFDRGKATTNAIAKVAGVSIGSLYEYFPNKEAILASLFAEHLEEAQLRLHAVLAGLDPTVTPLDDALSRLVTEMLALHSEHRGLHRRLVARWMGQPTERRRIATVERMFRQALHDWLLQHPEVPEQDLEVALKMVVEGTNDLVHRYVEDDEGIAQERFVGALVGCWGGYLRRGP